VREWGGGGEVLKARGTLCNEGADEGIK